MIIRCLRINFYRRNRYLFAIRITPLLFFYLDVIRILTISCCTLLLFFFILSPFSLNLFSGLFGSRGNACAVMMTVDYLTLLHFLSFGAHLSKIVIKHIKKTFFIVIFLHYIFHLKTSIFETKWLMETVISRLSEFFS